MTLRLGTIRMLALGTVFLGVAALQAGPAAAQGGVVCAFGPSDYRACCRQSYASHPHMSAGARADDIDACMNREPDQDSGSSPKNKRERDEDDDND
jgi:hypothetical protein